MALKRLRTRSFIGCESFVPSDGSTFAFALGGFVVLACCLAFCFSFDSKRSIGLLGLAASCSFSLSIVDSTWSMACFSCIVLSYENLTVKRDT